MKTDEHVHDKDLGEDGCCECGSPHHCCCDCPRFGGPKDEVETVKGRAT
jgi:hypothetical protein